MIRFTVGTCSLGQLLVAATSNGVCAVSLGDSAAMLESWLADEFPGQEITREDASLRGWFEMIAGSIGSQSPIPTPPLDAHGTPFQHRVWAELARIPPGETRTYREVAESLGSPTAVRAVARACATNPISILVPCHRVVGSDGQLRGYRWGIDRKQKLLQAEKSASARGVSEKSGSKAFAHPSA